MSVYKNPRSPFWLFDFWLDGCRFHGSTKCTTKREAEGVEAAEREKAKQYVKQTAAARTSMRLDDVAGRYWAEHGRHLAAAHNTEWHLKMLIEFFGKDKVVTEITGDDVAKLVAWRRGHRARFKGANSTLISPHTVNRTTETLRKLFTRCKLWGARFEHEPVWRKYMLAVASERVRELSEDEAERLDAAVREDYAPFFRFARATGLRLTECLLKWSEVDFAAKQIRKPGKGGNMVKAHITSEVREILWPLRGHHSEWVFTYLPRRRGTLFPDPNKDRRPITYGGVGSYWKLLRKRAGVVGFRFHDFRHDFGTKFLRATGNLKLTQKAMNHADIKTTLRYAHVLDSEVAEALERVAKSRTKSRTALKVVGDQ
jgi:integrase